jgi:hypothetical protein
MYRQKLIIKKDLQGVAELEIGDLIMAFEADESECIDLLRKSYHLERCKT